jgi:hypothetical protein
VLTSTPVLAAGRTPYGGTLALAYPGPPPPEAPGLADSLLHASVQGLTRRGVCRLDAGGQAQPALALAMQRPRPQTLEVTLPGPAHAEALARAWVALAAAEGGASPYRALLHPLQGEGRTLSARGAVLELPLAYPWPDLERGLCHPALRPPQPAALGPFVAPRPPGPWRAQPLYPEGRPYLDALTVTGTDERGLARLVGAHQVQVALGVPASGAPATSGPALQATYLAFSPRRVAPDFRQALESAIDREDLTRLFVRAPAVPMPHLLPPALLAQGPGARPAPPPGPATLRDVTLLYDADVEDQRAVAERLQVKLHERGYRVALQGLAHAALRSRWARGDYELLLHSLLLPPVAGPALAVVLEAGGRHDLLGVELPLIGALPEPQAREARARARALALAPSVPLVPLYAQGLAVQAAPQVRGLVFDAQGLAVLDGVFLAPGGGAP